MQSTRRVENHHLDVQLAGLRDPVLADLHRPHRRVFRMHGHTQLGTQNPQLLDGRRTLQVGRNQHRSHALRLQQLGQLAAGRGFPTPLQPAHHQDGDIALAKLDLVIDRPHQGRQLLIQQMHKLLRRIDRLKQILSERGRLHPIGELLHHVIIHIGFQQCLPHLAQTAVDIALSQFSAHAEKRQSGIETACHGLEHNPSTHNRL